MFSKVPGYYTSSIFKMQELFSGALGWVKGLEPSISRATIWRLSQLGHTHHARGISILVSRELRKKWFWCFSILRHFWCKGLKLLFRRTLFLLLISWRAFLWLYKEKHAIERDERIAAQNALENNEPAYTECNHDSRQAYYAMIRATLDEYLSPQMPRIFYKTSFIV